VGVVSGFVIAHADGKHSDWVTHQHRDTLASIVGHPTLTSFLAIADGESIGRIKFEMTEVGSIFFLIEKSCVFVPVLTCISADAAAVWTPAA
jgi:hypothetical protein